MCQSKRLVARRLSLGAGGALLLATSCVQVRPQADFERARTLIRETTGVETAYDPYADQTVKEDVDATLREGLSRRDAVRLALLNNRELQADMLSIGIAHADAVQARLLPNPSLNFLWRLPVDGGTGVLEAIVGQELLAFWRMDDRADAARQTLESVVLGIARRAGELAAETEVLYFEAVAARARRRVAEGNLDVVHRTYEVIRARHAAGSADAFDENLARGQLLTARVAGERARAAVAAADRRLLVILSLGGSGDGLVLSDPLPEPRAADVPVPELLDLAWRSRLDLRALESAVAAADAQAALEERMVWGELSVGPAFQSGGSDGSSLLGASAVVTVPLFDRNQAQIARARFRLEQLRKLHEAAVLAVEHDVRTNADRARAAARILALYRDELLPQVEENVAQAQESYRAGRTTIIALLETQRTLLETRRQSIDAQLESAAAAADLDRALGTPPPGRPPGQDP